MTFGLRWLVKTSRGFPGTRGTVDGTGLSDTAPDRRPRVAMGVDPEELDGFGRTVTRGRAASGH